jgi:hypothetical protein
MSKRKEKTKQEIMSLWEQEYVSKSQAGRMLGRGYRSIKMAITNGRLKEEVDPTNKRIMIAVRTLRQYAIKSYKWHKRIIDKMVLPRDLTKDTNV